MIINAQTVVRRDSIKIKQYYAVQFYWQKLSRRCIANRASPQKRKGLSLPDIEEDIVSAKIRYPGALYHPSNCSERANSCG